MELLKFPIKAKPSSAPPPPPSIRPAATFESIDIQNAQEMLKLLQGIMTESDRLLDFVDTHRDVARQAGIESIGIEISSMLEGEKLDAVVDALETAVEKGVPANISQQGLARIRRIERLVAEAASNITRFSDHDLGTAEALGGRLPLSKLAGIGGSFPSAAGGFPLWVPFVFLGLVAIGAIAYGIASSDDR